MTACTAVPGTVQGGYPVSWVRPTLRLAYIARMTLHWSCRLHRHHDNDHLRDLEVAKNNESLNRAMVCPLDALPGCSAGRDILTPVLPLCAAASFRQAVVDYSVWDDRCSLAIIVCSNNECCVRFPMSVLRYVLVSGCTWSSRESGRRLQPLAFNVWRTKITQDPDIIIKHFNRCIYHDVCLLYDIGFLSWAK
jgi:hypothetical protein